MKVVNVNQVVKAREEVMRNGLIKKSTGAIDSGVENIRQMKPRDSRIALMMIYRMAF